MLEIVAKKCFLGIFFGNSCKPRSVFSKSGVYNILFFRKIIESHFGQLLFISSSIIYQDISNARPGESYLVRLG